MKVLAGIVLYNPDAQRLKKNFSAIKCQVDRVLFIDNDSDNIDLIEEKFADEVIIYKNTDNKGIATALNQIFQYAITNGYDVVVTLDQDSISQPELIKRYKKIYEKNSNAMLTCMIEDRNFGHDRLDEKQKKYAQKVDFCITSACFCPVYVYKKVGAFDEQMFIDSVDFDYCIRVRKKGLNIIRIKYVGLIHEVGHGKKVRILWRDFVAFNHSPLRNYYMVRNDVYLARKHGNKYNSYYRVFVRTILNTLIVWKCEKNRLEKTKSRIKGLLDAFKMQLY